LKLKFPAVAEKTER